MVFLEILCVRIADSVITIMAAIAFYFFICSASVYSVTIFWFFPIVSISINCGKFQMVIAELHDCNIFILGKEEGGEREDFSYLSDLLVYSPNDRFLTDQLCHLLLKLSNISVCNGFTLISHLRDLELNPRHPLCV